MECKATKMELLPVLKLLFLLLLSLVTFTSGQTDDSFFRATDKFTARSFSQPEPSGPRVGRNSNRRNIFFPPPDRLSPTLRPILSLQELSSTTEKPAIQLSRFHPTGPSKYSPVTKKDQTLDYDDLYYDYYDEYYEEDLNTTSKSGLAASKPNPVPPSKSIASNTKFNNPPTAFSKFHTGNFRFSSPNRESVHETTSRQTTTKSPFRFRFTSPQDRERTTKLLPIQATPASSSSRKGSLADLIAQLKTQITTDDNPSSNDVNPNRDGRSFEKPREDVPSRQQTKDLSDLRYRVTNTTESTFAVGSVHSSHSIQSQEKPVLSNPPIFRFISTTSESPTTTTESTFLSDLISETDVETTESLQSFREEGKRVLEDTPPEENLTDHIPEPEGPPISNSFPSLFENIQIAVDPSLLPPGYSVEEAITETAPEEPEQTEEPHPPAPSSSTKSETTTLAGSITTVEDIFSSLPQEDVTSFLPSDYSPSTESISNFTSESHSNSSTDEESANNTETENIIAAIFGADNTNISTTERIVIEVKTVDSLSFLPPGYKPPNETRETEDEPLPGIPISTVDVSAFLPPGYKPKENIEEEEKPPVPGIPIKTIDVSKFLPPGYKPPKDETTEAPLPGIPIKTVDIASFLPPGYKDKVEEKEGEESPLPGIPVKEVDISKFLPPGFNSKSKSENTTTTTTTTTTEAPAATTLRVGKSGIVFPRRPKRPQVATTTTTTSAPKLSRPPPVKPKIQNLFDRVKALATTEYVPEVATPKSQAAGSGPKKESAATTTVTTTTPTTTTRPTTTTPPRPTTPGICGSNCRLAASLRLTAGTEWQPELANRDTLEFQQLANEVETELDAFYRSSSLSQWYDRVEVDSFNPGSVIVWYFLSLIHIKADVDTKDLKERLNRDLELASHSIGNFTIDPEGTDFEVVREAQVLVQDDSQNFLIPEWLIAVIVIGLASFLFILIFGVVALVSRARVRKRANVPLTEEFLNNLNALQVNGIDNYAMNGLYDMDPVWSEKYPEKSMKPPSSRGKGYNPEYNVNIYDSWRTDYSGPYTSSSANQSKRRTELDFDGKQFYKDDPYDF